MCTEFDVTQLADHLIGSVTYFGAVARAGDFDRLVAFTGRAL